MPFFGAVRAACDYATVARWSANPLSLLWPEMAAAFVTSGGGLPTAPWQTVIVVAAG